MLLPTKSSLADKFSGLKGNLFSEYFSFVYGLILQELDIYT